MPKRTANTVSVKFTGFSYEPGERDRVATNFVISGLLLEGTIEIAQDGNWGIHESLKNFQAELVRFCELLLKAASDEQLIALPKM